MEQTDQNTYDFLKRTIKGVDEETLVYAASHLITKTDLHKNTQEAYENLEHENKELRQMQAKSDQTLEVALTFQTMQHDTNSQLRKALEMAQNQLKKNHGEGGAVEYDTRSISSEESEEQKDRIDKLEKEIQDLKDGIQVKDRELNKLKSELKKVTEDLTSMKKKLGLPPKATQEALEQKIAELESGRATPITVKLIQDAKTMAWNRRRKQDQINEHIRQQQHKQVQLTHYNLMLQCERDIPRPHPVSKGNANRLPPIGQSPRRVPYTTPSNQSTCLQCGKALHVIQLCDVCNTQRLNLK